MSSQQHIIQKLTIEIGLPDRDGAFGLQTRITNDYQRLVLKSMSEVFDQLVSPNEFLSIDKLEIDLGRVGISDLDYEFPGKIRKEIEEALAKLLNEARNTPGGNAQVRVMTSEGDTITVRASLKNDSASFFEALIHYLEFGLLPWASNKKEKPGLRFLLSEAMTHHPEELRIALTRFRDKPHVFRRLALQVKEDQLQYLAAILGSGFSSRLNEFYRQLLALTKTLSKQDLKSGGVKMMEVNALKVFFWQEALHYFSKGNTGSGKEEEMLFLSGILKRLIALTKIKIAKIKRAEGDFEDLKKALKKIKEIDEEQGLKIKEVEEDTELKIKEVEEGAKSKIKEVEEGPELKIKEELPETPEAEEGIYIENAGMVILAAYLHGFFKRTGLVEGREFVSENAQWKAVHLLQWMVYGEKGMIEKEAADKDEETTNEHELILNKIFCGIDIAEPVPLEIDLTESEKEEATQLLQSVIQNWSIINRISVHALQTTFLQKEGKLKRVDKSWNLFIHRDSALDIIIDRLPWSISMIKLPWNKDMVYVEW